jgi:hypothetical protein
MADPAGGQPDEHFSGLRLGEIDLLDLEWLTELLEDSSPDLQPLRPPSVSAPNPSSEFGSYAGLEIGSDRERS